jgi:hypothetical protein
MNKAPPLERKNVRSTAPRMHGDSGPAHPAHHKHVHYSAHGDRGDMVHSPPARDSAPPPVTAGRSPDGAMNGGGGNNGIS